MEKFEQQIQEAKSKKNLAAFIIKINKDIDFQNYLKNKTLYLNENYNNVTINQRLYHLYYNCGLEICPICNKPKKWNIKNKFSAKHKTLNYNRTCGSTSCKLTASNFKNITFKKYGVENISQTDLWKNKIKNTYQTKYNTDYYFQTDEFKEKFIITNLKKRGTKHHLQTQECLNKQKQTNLKKYGFECNLQDVKKREKTCLEKYGETSPMKTEQIKEKVKQTNLKKYGVEWIMGSDEFKKKVKQTNLRKYGVEHNSQISETIEKRNRSKYQWKEYTLPSGKIVKVQGYENKYLNELFLNGYNEKDIFISNRDIENQIGKIFYFDNMQQRRYFPDFYIKSENKIIEVKSKYTYKINEIINLNKKQACLDLGFNFKFIIYD